MDAGTVAGVALNGRSFAQSALLLEGGSNRDQIGIVNAQQSNCCAANLGQFFQSWSIPDKVFSPFIAPGMEQANDSAAVRIDPGNVRPLEAIAMDAGEGQIIRYGWSTMLLSDNVINLEWRGM
jgi:hypothetical protein